MQYNLIEKGWHAEVYKGQLADGQFVAIQAYCILKFKLTRITPGLCIRMLRGRPRRAGAAGGSAGPALATPTPRPSTSRTRAKVMVMEMNEKKRSWSAYHKDEQKQGSSLGWRRWWPGRGRGGGGGGGVERWPGLGGAGGERWPGGARRRSRGDEGPGGGPKRSAGLEEPGGEAGATRGLAEGQRGALAWRSPAEKQARRGAWRRAKEERWPGGARRRSRGDEGPGGGRRSVFKLGVFMYFCTFSPGRRELPTTIISEMEGVVVYVAGQGRLSCWASKIQLFLLVYYVAGLATGLERPV
ncbi:translation initiation factor IF-2 isoform X2 [Triticum aestivum]|uniref:translation initiation factor IF-2 isoform X2 n=1 Tax=Triticum aestivum TaxID=4565 RepID=UPI001D0256B2|nr:translation initiation factor IF-2-like isoform X2 [Triticum aestivum]